MYDKAILLDPNKYRNYLNKGIIYLIIIGIALSDLNRYKEAIIEYDKAIILNPFAAKSYISKGFYEITIN